MKKRCFRPYQLAHVSDSSVLVKPLTFMNESGKAISRFVPRRYNAEQIVVVCDTLDLPPGMIRIRKGGSSAGHNGLKSIIASIGSSDFIRVYVGVGRPAAPVTVVQHVLSAFEHDSDRDLFMSGMDQAKRAVIDLIGGQRVSDVAALYNRKNTS